MLSCIPADCDCCCACEDGAALIHSGNDCSSINELADMMGGGAKLSVFGAPLEAGRPGEYACECPVSLVSERLGFIQLGSIPSSISSDAEKL